MRRNRFRGEDFAYRLPTPPAPVPAPDAFVFCPLPLLQNLTAAQWLFAQCVYQQAMEQAQAVLRPSLPERDLLGVWN
jgi:hypothetical protein